MLNLSDNRVEEQDYLSDYKSLQQVQDKARPVKKLKVFTAILIGAIGFSFLPWTQNVRITGKLNTLYPEQRPQTVQNVIPGRIAAWFVREGELVQKGDTILQISEVNDQFFDPQIVERLSRQLKSKNDAANNYTEKAEALSAQIEALRKNRFNKKDQAINLQEQSRLRVVSDSMDVVAAQIDFEIAQQRLQRMEELHEKGLKSLTDLETRKMGVQESRAVLISAENQYESSLNAYENARIELASIDNEFDEKTSKARAERNATLSALNDTEAEIAKLENQVSNLQVRRDNYYVTAPQTGYVTQAISVGIGENIAAGSRIVSIMPLKYDLATEMYVSPVDFPLLEKGNTVRLIFDGWPAIIFSGWPRLSNGTFSGEILAIDNFISNNGMYRILVVPDPEAEPWPSELRVGSGADGILLLKDVPIWYEVWRQLNGFPPDYYRQLELAQGETAKQN